MLPIFGTQIGRASNPALASGADRRYTRGMKFSKEEIAESIGRIYGLSCEGKTDDEIMDEMGLPAEDYRELKAAMFDAKADEFRAQPTEHRYVQYVIDQSQNVRDLTVMIESFKTTKQYNALVGAVRCRSEIYKGLIEMGQSFGILRKEPDRKMVIGGILVADLSNRQLKTTITEELKSLDGLMRRYGEKTILEINPGPIHRGPALPPASSSVDQLIKEMGGGPGLSETKAKAKAKNKTGKRRKRVPRVSTDTVTYV